MRETPKYLSRIRVLIMGLPGSGKTILTDKLKTLLDTLDIKIERLEGNKVCFALDDCTYNEIGFLNQAVRLSTWAHHSHSDLILVDFIAPTLASQLIFHPHVVVWVNNKNNSEFEETNTLFTRPQYYNFEVTDDDFDKWANIIFDYIKGNYFNEH